VQFFANARVAPKAIEIIDSKTKTIFMFRPPARAGATLCRALSHVLRFARNASCGELSGLAAEGGGEEKASL